MKSKRELASFTLVEMLVSIAVFSLIVVLLAAIISGAAKLWRNQSSEEASFREARAALYALSHDLNGAIQSTNPNWFYTDGTTQLAFLTTLPDFAQASVNKSTICAVGYSLEWGQNDSSGVQNNWSLYRYVSFSDYTYTTYISGTSPVQNIFINPDGVNTVRELVARDIPTVSFVAYTNDATGVAWINTASPVTVLPNMINVTITTLNDRAVPILTGKTQWQNAALPIVQQNEESFALRVRPQGP
jgi:type II secretory pathway pseudopilin PulG